MSRIDVHHHVLPPRWIAEARDHKPGGNWPAHVVGWTPQRSLEQLDRHGIARAIVSLGLPGVWWGDVAAARRLARECNEYAAQMTRDHPGRFGFFATLPLPDIEGALAEIAYALDVLGADGITMLTSYDDRWQGHPLFAPVYDELERRGTTVFVHPTVPVCCRGLMDDVPPATVEYLFDTTRAVTNLMFTGTLGRLDRMHFIFAHAGGTIPMVAARIAHIAAESEKLRGRLPHGPEPQLAKLYFDVATSVSAPTFGALRAFTPMDRILFGSDFPYVDPEETVSGFEALDLTPAEREAIERGNAARLFSHVAAGIGA